MATINPSNQQITNHAIQVGAANNLLTSLAVGSTGTILQGNTGADPTFSTATYPATATGTGTILRADGTNWVATTSTYPNTNAVNTLLYASSANVMGALATANSGVLTTDASGVPSIDTTNFVRQTTGMQMKGNNTNTAPPAGFIGEQISNYASGVSLTSTTPADVTSISVTAGIWDISAVCMIANSGFNLTLGKIGISVNSASYTGCVSGDSFLTLSSTALLSNGIPLCISGFRVTLSGTTTYYLVGQGNGSGTITANGRISATRVG